MNTVDGEKEDAEVAETVKQNPHNLMCNYKKWEQQDTVIV